MTGFFALEAAGLALVVLAFLVGRVLVSSSESLAGEELASVAEEESGGDESCLRFLALATVLLGAELAWKCQMIEGKGVGRGKERKERL